MKNVVVTGCSYGLGFAICQEFLNSGHRVFGISRTEPKVSNTNFTWIKADLLNDSDISKIHELIGDYSIDILINNAGMTVEKNALDYSNQDFLNVFGLNFVAPIKLTKLFFGDKSSSGLVINISSNSDRYPDPLWAMYGSSKAALNLYFDTIAVETPALKVISLLPSFIDTPLLQKCYVEEGFDITKSMKSAEVASYILELAQNNQHLSSGSRIIVVNNSLASVVENPENLSVYNVETKKLDRIIWKITTLTK